MPKTAIIIGAGPAGLTAAYELLKRTDIIPLILEKSGDIGGISKTIDYKGNRMDMGPHRFFSKSDRVMDWWLNLFPLDAAEDREPVTVYYQNRSRTVEVTGGGPVDGKDPDQVMLVIRRLTRIYFLRRFFAYPIKLSLDTLKTLGLIRTIRIVVSYVCARLFPRRPVNSLEDFIVNQFGRELYGLFFKDYTEKVWGVPCSQISAEWGAQRIKGVSLSRAVSHAIRMLRQKKDGGGGVGQKETETSLVEQFLYPKRGPGQLWEEVARQIMEMGGQVYLHQDVRKIDREGGVITAVHTVHESDGTPRTWEGDYFFSTMPVQELIRDLDSPAPANVKEVADGLQYRDFINVGLLLRQLSTPGKEGINEKLVLKDNWIYVQERDVKVGRLMIYNNWGAGMIKDPNTVWIGMEYFCNKSDAFWALSDEAIRQIAIGELVKMDLARAEDVLDGTVARMEKTYPAYFGTYDRFGEIRDYLDAFANLFLIGRNGMHKYNNADHSMLTAMVAVDNILAGVTSKANLWAINTEQEYHEEKQEAAEKAVVPEAVVSEPTAGTLARPVRERTGIPEPLFRDYIWRNRSNRAYLLFALAAFLVEFTVFKFLYPYANYMPDSYSYLQAAASNADVNMWPVAYSKFLRLMSVFSHSDKVVVGVQYFLLEASGLYFLFNLFHFYTVNRVLKHTLLLSFIFCPLQLFVSNYISADALFAAFSFLWMAVLIRIIHRPQKGQVIIQGLLLLALFTLRYNAIYYPLIAALAFLLSRQSWQAKVTGILFGSLLVAASVWITTNEMNIATGRRQFSAFGGWQMANNALYMYGHVRRYSNVALPEDLRPLDKAVRAHFDTSKTRSLFDRDWHGIFYLWSGHAPLAQYERSTWHKDSSASSFKKWASMGPLYSNYGMYLIKTYPVQFIRYFIWPNTMRYALPPAEFLEFYNMGRDSVGGLAKNWFDYKSVRIRSVNKQLPGSIFRLFPVFFFVINLIFVAGLSWYFSCRWKWRGTNRNLLRLVIVVGSFWILNTGFSVLASPVVMRYETFPMLLLLPFSLFLLETVNDIQKNEPFSETTTT